MLLYTIDISSIGAEYPARIKHGGLEQPWSYRASSTVLDPKRWIHGKILEERHTVFFKR
jgi:hypothetical protein